MEPAQQVVTQVVHQTAYQLAALHKPYQIIIRTK